MNPFQAYSQVFIVRIWIEPREDETREGLLRGVVEHVPGGEKHYIQQLDDIAPIILGYISARPDPAPHPQSFLSRAARRVERLLAALLKRRIC